MKYINFFLIFFTSVAMAFAATVSNAACANNSKGIFPDPNDCSGYYECKFGTLVLRHCYPGTAWNLQKQTCDWAYNVADCNGKEPSRRNNQNKAPTQPSWNQAPTQPSWNNNQNQIPAQPAWNNQQNQAPTQPSWNNKQNQVPIQNSWNNRQTQVPIQPSWNNNQNQVPNQQLWNKIPAFPSEEDC